MKKISLLLTGLLLVVTSAQASEKINTTVDGNKGLTKRYRYTQPIKFVERGVEFFVFKNGEFDFNTHRTVYNRSRRGSVNATFGAPGVRVRYSGPRRGYGVRVEHDHLGRVRRVGNTFINYNRVGQVKRIGSVYMQYNRRGLLRQIGGLYLRYNRWGRLVSMQGRVNQGAGCTVGHIGQDNDDWYDNGYGYDDDDDFDDDYDDDDDNYYYYRGKNGKTKKRKIDD